MKYTEEIYKKRRIDTRWEKLWVCSFFSGLACIVLYAFMGFKVLMVLGGLLIVFAGLAFILSIEVLEKKYNVVEEESE